jgi:hypothetical protein
MASVAASTSTVTSLGVAFAVVVTDPENVRPVETQSPFANVGWPPHIPLGYAPLPLPLPSSISHSTAMVAAIPGDRDHRFVVGPLTPRSS